MIDTERLVLAVDSAPEPEDLEAIHRGLSTSYEADQVEPRDEKPLAVTLRTADGRLRAGLSGRTYWGWLHVRHSWVDEELRGLGLGRRLMEAAEEEAVRRGCRQSHLSTYSFQALDFYRRLGYRVFGALEDFPPGHRRFFLRKRLVGKEGG